MTHIASRFGFQYHHLVGCLHLFSKRTLTRTERFVLARAVSNPAQKWVRAYLGYRLSFESAMRDSGLLAPNHDKAGT